MRRLIPNLLLICACASVSFGTFDHVISDSYEFGTFILNDESLLVTGAGAYGIFANNTSYVEVQHTAPLEQYVGGIYTFGLVDSSTLNYYGGEMGGFSIYDDAVATFSGGSVNYISSYQFAWRQEGHPSVLVPNPHITFVCDVDSVDLAGNLLTGNWLDGSGFSVTLSDRDGYDPVIENIQFIPEPATLLLFGIGGLAIRKKRSV